MILNHYSEKPFKFNPRKKYNSLGLEDMFLKPHGLWLSDCSDYGWKEWCEGEQWNLDGLGHVMKFECDTSKWAVLKNLSEMNSFTKEWRRNTNTVFSTTFSDAIEFSNIDWPKVAAAYSGILITPYMWPARNKFMWYYGWDCASACVWDLSTVRLHDE